ncbi:MAG: Hsp20 family protein [Maritimibacter sp.]|nr:Hsp20 family protein [Maritimibacter sp.]
MTKMTLGSHPFLLGFDQLERMLEQAEKSGTEGYPPFNIEQVSDRAYRITLAVAGFADDDLSITVEDRKLVVRGRISAKEDHRVYLHRGIAARQFMKSFVLADGVEVIGAATGNGLLHIDLERAIEERRVQTIEIRKG